MKDIKGQTFEVGQKVIRAQILRRSPYLAFQEVTRIENGKIYLDNSPVALNFPSRIFIVNEEINV